MSFLNPTYSATVAARLTQKGRNAIASGNFNVSYFAVGDSEYNYNRPSTQTILEPFDKDINVKAFNIGTNAGKIAGQSIMHCHIHLIPRREGDVENPQGGVRSVIPQKQHYKRKI